MFLSRPHGESGRGTERRPTFLRSSLNRHINHDRERDGGRQSKATGEGRSWIRVHRLKRKRCHDNYMGFQARCYRMNKMNCREREESSSWIPKATRTKRTAIIPKPYFPVHFLPYQSLHLTHIPPPQKPVNRHLSGNPEESGDDERDRCAERGIGNGKERPDDLSRKEGVSVRLRCKRERRGTLKS